MCKISVIIPTYKRSEKILGSINSILNQDYPNKIEIIVVDDNGENEYTKETENKLNYLIEENLIIYIKHHKNQGACVARNSGAEIATGKYLFFLDDDDIFLPNKVIKQVQFLENNKLYDGCLSAFIRLDNDGKEIISDSNYPSIGSFKNFVINGNFFTPMLCIRRSSFQKIKGFIDIHRFQDRYFMIHCLKNNMKFAEIKEKLYIMHDHFDNRITQNSVEKSIGSLNTIKRYIIKYKSEFSKNEWNNFLERDDNMRATIYYVSNSYITRLKSFVLWIKCFKQNYKLSYLIKSCKSIFPNINKKY